MRRKVVCLHPVHGGLDISKAGGRSKHEISQRFAQCYACHGCRIHEALEGLFADGGSSPCQPCMCLSHDCHVSHGQLQWATALLLCNEPCSICRRVITLSLTHYTEKPRVDTISPEYLENGAYVHCERQSGAKYMLQE